MTSPYSPLKIFRHRAYLDLMAHGQHLPPIHTQIIPTNRCNQNCRACAYRLPGYTSAELFNPRDEIPSERLLELASDCYAMGVKAIEVTGGGEPTLHPAFDALCGLILFDYGIDLGVVSNGTNWRQERVNLVANAHWVRISIDAGTPETYASYRHSSPTMFHEVRGTVRKLAAAKRKHTILGVGFVVTADNWREILLATQNAKEDGADNIRISAAFQPQGTGYFATFGDQAEDLCLEAKGLEDKRFKVFNNFSDRLSDLAIGHPKDPDCGFQRVSTYIGADLNVYRCCVLAYSTRGILGSLRDQRYSAMWFSEETMKKFREFDARQCPRCMFTGKNDAIRYATCLDPMHVNFI